MSVIQDIGRIGFSDEQGELLEAARVFCQDKSTIGEVRRLITDELGHDASVWAEMGTLGWLGVAVPEAFGGLGLPLGAVVPMVEQMGRRLLAGPFVSTTLAAQALIAGGTSAQRARHLPPLAAGRAATLALMEAGGDWDLEAVEARAVAASGNRLRLFGAKTLVLDAAVAEIVIASVSFEGRPSLVIIEKDDLPRAALRRETVVDETRRAFALALDDIEIPMENLFADGPAALSRLHLAANLLGAAEMCGGAQAAIDDTVEYLKTRKQFGKLIGSYQALKHPIVDAYAAYEQARSHLYSAAHCFDEQGAGEIATRMAKVQADGAFSFASDRAIQFHGGFGFTYDCNAQLYRRRAIWHASQYGDALFHKRKLAELLL